MTQYTAAQLEEMPTIHSGHFDNLKIENDDRRVWLSRCETNKIYIEQLIDGKWLIVEEYWG